MNTIEASRRTNLTSMVTLLDTDNSGRRVWTDQARKEVIKFYDERHISAIGFSHPLDYLEKTLNVKISAILKWKKAYKKNGVMRSIIGGRGRRPQPEPLKVNSSAAKGKIIGTTLKNVLRNINKKDIIQQIQMVEILSEAGYDENTLTDHLEIAAPSLKEWKQIKDALKLLSENFDIEIKPKI